MFFKDLLSKINLQKSIKITDFLFPFDIYFKNKVYQTCINCKFLISLDSPSKG